MSGPRGGALTGPNPTDRGKAGSRYHLLVDATGLPLAIAVSGANRHDSKLVEPLLDGMRAVKGVGRGRPRRRPVKLHGDKGYDTRRVRRYLARRGITARIARIGRDCSEHAVSSGAALADAAALAFECRVARGERTTMPAGG